jgi:DNA-binding NtrC family response regulator
MAQYRILISWIGHADLLAMIDDLGAAGEELRAAAKIGGKYGEKPGPLKTAVNEGSFDEVHLLSNYADVVHKPFAKWLGCKPVIHPVDLADPTDYDGIFRCTNRVLSEISEQVARNRAKLCILLSPGTPAMAVVWVLLGKSRYPASFYQTGRGKLHEAKIPAALFEEVVPDLIRDRDIALQHLASRNPADVEGFEQVVGGSTPIRLAVGRAQRAALRDVPVLLLGESGTGKEVFAQAIHKASRRSSGPFEAINCAAIPRDLLEAELFGHAKGAYTGADKKRSGAFTRNDGGTLFLDEIGECDPLLQSKLLRVLQPPTGKNSCYREFRAVGGDELLTSNVRIVAATNRDLQREIKAQRFREDLYYRLAVITLQLPPLRERRTDIPLLANAFLAMINKDFKEGEPGYKDKTISTAATEFVKRYGWPGNVRQLYNALLQAAVMTDNNVIDRQDITSAIGEMDCDQTLNMLEQPLGDGFDLEEHINSLRRHYLRRAMSEANGNKTRAARLLGMKHYQTLDAQLDRIEVDLEDKKKGT